MQPERIKGESQGAPTSYTASSDVWSLGLSIIEFAIGHYPYPPETYSNVFAQLTAIVHGEPPVLPAEYSDSAREFVRACLRKVAGKRPTYAQLMVGPLDPTSSRRILTRRNLGPSVLEGRHWTRSRHGRLDRRCARLPREAPQDLYSRPRLRRRPRPSFLSLDLHLKTLGPGASLTSLPITLLHMKPLRSYSIALTSPLLTHVPPHPLLSRLRFLSRSLWVYSFIHFWLAFRRRVSLGLSWEGIGVFLFFSFLAVVGGGGGGNFFGMGREIHTRIFSFLETFLSGVGNGSRGIAEI